MEKYCKYCNKIKQIDEFPEKGGKCKKCKKEVNKKYHQKHYQKNIFAIKEKHRQYYKNNPEKIKRGAKLWRKNNPEKANKINKKEIGTLANSYVNIRLKACMVRNKIKPMDMTIEMIDIYRQILILRRLKNEYFKNQ